MPERRYTITPQSDAETALRTLVDQLRDAVVDELEPAALLLSGSFARGEGGAYITGGALRTTSDLDLIAVFRGPFSVARTVLARRKARALSHRLRRRFPGTQIDLTVRPALLLTWPPATLDYYDLLRSARVLYGAVRVPSPAAVRLDDIPPEERRRVLVKRGVGLLNAWLRLSEATDLASDADARAVESDIDKAYLASGDAWLHRYAHYDHRLLVRMERLRNPYLIREPTDTLRFEYEASGRRRLTPHPIVSRSAATHQARWPGAAEEWLRAAALLDAWEQHADARRDIHPWRHPARATRHLIATMRRLARGLPSPARLREALPLLLRLALGHEGSAWLSPTIAGLLRLPPSDPSVLTTLIHGFLFAWDSGDAPSAPAVEVHSLARGWQNPLPFRRPA
ncbi:MAG TPA: hypothetical protein VL563_06530 [Gemmatimonadales bacterium]|nr:hypothetical protein [Gemmatimonadales bacterium]